jgi:GT2 family glycosyltransferase
VSLLLSVVIPTCQRADQLAECLELLAPERQGLAEDLYEIIVTDDGVNATSESLLHERFPWVKWTEGPHRGPAANRNHGAGQARGEWLVFCDDDCLPGKDLLQEYRKAFESEDAFVFEGKIRPDREKQRLDEVAPINESGGYLWSCNFAIRRSLFVEVGGFDERFPFAALEDVELRNRLLKRGLQIIFLPAAEVVHPWRRFGGFRTIRRSIESHRIYWIIDPSTQATYTTLYFVMGAIRIACRVFSETIRFRGRGIFGGMQEILLWAGLGFAATFRTSSDKSKVIDQ